VTLEWWARETLLHAPAHGNVKAESALARLVHVRRAAVRVRSALLALVLTVAGPHAARADGDPRGDARVHYERGIELTERRAYDEALVEFRRAYERSPHFAVLYNIGLCHVALGRPVDALEVFSRYLAEGGAEVPSERRAQVETQIREIEARFAELTITADRAGTEVAVDGRALGRTPLERPVRLPAGAHEISATLDGVPVLKRRIELAEAERRTFDVAFAQTPVTSSPAPAPLPAPVLPPDDPKTVEKTETSGPFRTVGTVLLGTGIAAGVGGIVHYAWNRGRHDDWEAEQARLSAEPPPLDYRERALANNELADSIERASTVTVGLFVASGVLVAGGTALIVVNPGGGGGRVAWSGPW